jgi:hypothetical protein
MLIGVELPQVLRAAADVVWNSFCFAAVTATASAGKTWPPVPPHTIAIFLVSGMVFLLFSLA